MFDLNWSALGNAPEPGQAFQKGFDRGQAQALETRKRSVLSAISANPRDAAAQSALFGLDPALAMQVQKGVREQDDSARAAEARGLAGRYLGQQTRGVLGTPSTAGGALGSVNSTPGYGGALGAALPPQQYGGALGSVLSPQRSLGALGSIASTPVLGMPSETGRIPADFMPDARSAAGGDDVVVQGRRAEPPVSIADIATLDPELAGRLPTMIGAMNETQRKQLETETGAVAAAAQYLSTLPYARRRDALNGMASQLEPYGFSRQELEAFDPSDEGLAGAIALGLGAKDALAAARDERKFEWQQRDDRIDNARDDQRVGIASRAQRDASARGWSADRRAERRFKRGDGANVSGMATDDLINALEN